MIYFQLEETAGEDKTDTDKNMATMFQILRRHKSAKLENLILNRKSFAQTVENLFALSFLIKDGRADISVDDKLCHMVCKFLTSIFFFIFFFCCLLFHDSVTNFYAAPKNAPASNAVLSGEVSYNHFVFRFDFQDWKVTQSPLFPLEMIRDCRCLGGLYPLHSEMTFYLLPKLCFSHKPNGQGFGVG